MPDGIGYIYDDWCDGSVETSYAATYKRYLHEREKSFSIGIAFKAFAASHSRSSFRSKLNIEYRNTHWTSTRSECHIYRA